LAGIFFTFSRGAWFSLFVSTLFLVFISNRVLLKKSLGICLGIFFGFYFLVPSFRQRLSTLNLEANQERLELWKVSWKMFKDSPWFGQGYDSFPFRFKLFSELLAKSPGTPVDPHNMYLEFLATSGLVGFIAFLVLLVSVLWFLKRTWGKLGDGSLQKPFFLATLGVFVSFCIGGFFDRYFNMPHTLVPLLISLGLCSSGEGKTQVPEKQ
jgi:O-antigen ligase